MLRSLLCLSFTVMLASAVFAQQRHVDVQSLEYEFGHRIVAPIYKPSPAPKCPPACNCAPVPRCSPVFHVPTQWRPVPVVHIPVRCCVPVARPVCVPVARPVVCAPVVRPVLVPKRIYRWHHPKFVW